ncbi:GDSL ESTERASE/LIPASE EXL3 [Salix purpurea]|uniref:GDSL ESTERASE/LIPASE EXL3 n=1 Tax=Salix purpurea TaxID=77065 RepID=A0A9Q0PBF8_SALPP|nr:GDSL ESTERASE/LIPASE EXL3 [Salix purpurea]
MKLVLSRLTSCCFYATVLLFLTAACSVKSSVELPANVTVPALLLFGDSIADTGNNNYIKTLVKCNFPPYGKDFGGGVPTGRFCDGKVPSDIIAKELGIKDTLPAYLDPTVLPQDLVTGVTFASGGSGFDPLTPKLASVISLSDQLKYLEEYIGKLEAMIGGEKTKFILTNSIFLVVAGSDDIANTYFTMRARKLQYDVSAYTDLMANSASSFTQKLYELGARRIGVFSAPPVGCVPAQRTLAGGAERKCAEPLNEAAKLFNSKISKKLDYLASSLPNGRFVYVDIYSPLLDLIQNPQKYGFQVADKGCCGTGGFEVSILCNQYTSVTCPNVSDHIFWDSYHPTESAYKALVSLILGEYVNKFF